MDRRVAFTDKQLRTIRLHREMKEHGKAIAVIDGPFQCGKTFAIAYGFVDAIASHPDRNADFAVAAQSLSLVRNTMFKNMKQACDDMDVEFTNYRPWQGYGTVAGRRVYGFVGANSGSGDRVRGISVAGVWIDEVTKCNREFVTEMFGRASKEEALIYLSTNPGGPQHWLKREFIDDLDSQDAIRVRYEMADNPNLDMAYIRLLDKTLSGAMKARYRFGEWVAAEGFIYPEFKPTEPPQWESPVQYDLAIDAGYASITHCLLIGTFGDERKWVVDEFRYDAKKGGSMSPDAIVRDIRQRLDWRAINRIIVDDAATSMKTTISEVFGIEPVAPLKLNAKGVLPGIHYTESLLKSGQLNVAPWCKETIRELQNYQWEEGADDKPLKEDDHACDALRYYAVRMLNSNEELVRL